MSDRKYTFQLNCPVPSFDFEHITLGHGSGGLLSQKLLDAGVFTVLENDWLREAHDGAIIDLPGRIAISTDSFVVSPIFFPGGNIGDLAVNGTVNDVAMCGALPRYLALSFILEEGLQMEEFALILQSIQQACIKAGVKVVTGDTKVVERGKGDKIFINTTGLGEMIPGISTGIENINIGDQIIVSGPLARHGISILSVRKGLEFDTVLESDTTNLNHTVAKLLERFGTDIHFLRDPTRGGVSSTLNEIGKKGQIGIFLQENQLPIDENVAGACEMLGLDPLYVANEGIFIMIVAKSKGSEILSFLQSQENGRSAKIIGEIVSDHPGQVVMQSRIGGRRVVNMLAGEQLPRIC